MQRPTRRLGVLAALLAMFVQALVVQTHVDPWPGARAGAEHSVSMAIASPADQTHNAAAACPICQVLATSGRAVLAASAELAPADFAAVQSVAPRIRWAPTPPAHTWRSRAPPLSL